MIRGPEDLRRLSIPDLESLAQEIRQKILTTCLKNGGHLGASLGAVEIAIAVHRVFESPREPIFWDVGHQAYAHKLLTGRWDQFSTLRLPGGISGFLSREENPHDAFGAGHSSTALSAALAAAWAARERSPMPWTVAVVGDGGLTAGIAFEALNNFRETPTAPFLLIVNDNQMSISQNSGAMPAILSEQASEFFQLFGFDYRGPVDGHDVGGLISVLEEIRESRGETPIVLHVVTQKGKGYAPAEELPSSYHGISPLQEKAPGAAAAPKQKSFSDRLGWALIDLARSDPKVVAITAAMKEGTGLKEFAEKFPDRFFDVGIAEPHAVTFAAGLAAQGFKPVVCIYSTFLQRALDSIIHDVSLQGLDVVFCIDRAGVVGADGPTHHGVFDLAYLGMIPGMKVIAPSCLSDLSEALAGAVGGKGPCAIRYPRGGGPEALETPLGPEGLRWHRTVENPELIVIALGTAAIRARDAAAEVDAAGERITMISTIHAKPIPSELMKYLEQNPNAKLLLVEDGVAVNGFGASLLSGLSGSSSRRGAWEVAGYRDHFIPHGTPAGLEDSEGLSRAALARRIQRLLLIE